MKRRGFMQTLFGGVVAALLPRQVKAKDVEGGGLLPQTVQDTLVSAMPPDVPALAALPQAERDRLLELPKDIREVLKGKYISSWTITYGMSGEMTEYEIDVQDLSGNTCRISGMPGSINGDIEMMMKILHKEYSPFPSFGKL